MGLLSSAIKLGKTVGKITDDLPVVTKRKRDINPLIKQTEEIFQSPDVRPQTLSQESILKRHSKDEAIYEYDEDIIGTMYSPVYSAIENMPIGKKGTKGENISAYLNKRAPNVDKAELESFEINLDPNKRYTREEVLDLAKEKGSADYTIEKQKYTEYEDTQRQNVKDGEVEYIELTVQGKQEYTGDPSYVHLGGTNNIGHTRSSIRRKKMGLATDKEMPATQKITDRDVYLLVEEMQSDLAKVRNNPEVDLDTGVDIDKYTDTIRAEFSDFKDGLDMDYNISVDNDVLGTVRTFYEDLFNPYTIDSLKDIENINADDTYRKLLITKIKTYHNNLDVAGKDLDTVALDAIRKTSDTSRGEINYSSDGDFEFDPEESLEREIKNLLNDVRDDINKLYNTKAKQKDTKKLPVASRTDYVKRLLLANIAYAKQNNINKIVIPSYKEIARQRIDGFDDIAMSDSLSPELLKKYKKALKDDTVGELAQEYYEGVFKPIYEDSVNKVLNSLKKETKGAIKTKTKKLEYYDASTHPEFRTSDALEIDITDFDYDPTKQGLRFNKGGKVPMMKQMKQFNEGGLRDEGGQVDEESGNKVPIGSTREEVRDDIPAQVSEGEFVFPADVVRYIGLEKLMEMRQAAKMGLKQMEAMGQMGNSDEATMPDDMPFGMADLVVIGGPDEEPQEKAYGGMAKKGVPSGMHRMPDGSLMKDSDMSQKKAQGGLFLQSGGSIRMPDFDSSNQDVRIYVKEGSPDRRIPFFDDEPVIPIPAGYVLKGSAPVEEETETEKAIPTGSDDDPRPPIKNAFVEAGSWSGSPLEMYIKEAEKISTFGNLSTGVGAAINPLIGGFMALAMRDQKKKILASIDKRIEEAKKTDVEGQVKALKAVKDRLTTKEGQGIVSKVIESFIKPLTDSIGITNPKTVEVVKKVSNKGANDNPNDDKGNKVVVDEIVKSAFPSGRLPIDTPPSVEDQTDEAIPLDQIYSEKEKSYLFEDDPKYKLGNLDQRDRLNKTVLNLQAADALDKSGINIVDPVVKAEEVTGGLGNVNTRFEDLKNKYAKLVDPSGRLSVDTPPKTFDDSLVYDITDNINSLVFKQPTDLSSPSTRPRSSFNQITEDDMANAKAAIARDVSTPDPVVTPTSSSDDDDDNDRDRGPSLAQQMQQARISASQNQASESSDRERRRIANIAARSGTVSAPVARNLSGAGMKAGVQVGAGVGGSNIAGPMNKGGLASRRKKK